MLQCGNGEKKKPSDVSATGGFSKCTRLVRREGDSRLALALLGIARHNPENRFAIDSPQKLRLSHD